MEIVRAGAHHHDELCSGIESVFGRVTAGDHPNLFHRFRRRREGNGVHSGFGSNHAIEGGMLADLALPVSDDRDRLSGYRHAAARAGLPIVAVARAEADTGIQNRKVADVAAVHGKFNEASLLHRTADRRFVCPEIGRFGSDRYLLSLRTDLETEIDTDFFINLENDSLPYFRLESRLIDSHLVFADIEKRECVITRISGYGCC